MKKIGLEDIESNDLNEAYCYLSKAMESLTKQTRRIGISSYYYAMEPELAELLLKVDYLQSAVAHELHKRDKEKS